MMKKTLLIPFLVLAFGFFSFGQTVPSRLEFAGLELRISDHARKEIQTDVDALTRYPKYFNIKVNRAKLYFPLIEEIFSEEGIPDDFKFLVLQESALIADAVSTSNAVGFWQFKKETAQEVGLRVDGSIDERQHIIASTYGAAKYLKTNHFYFRNWVYALLAYNTGRGGVERYVEQKYIGSSRMEIEKNTHWYIKKYLAHKIAFENAVKGTPLNRRLISYANGTNKNLEQISHEINLPVDTVKTYNKWLKRGKIPDDKTYLVVVPVEGNRQPAMIARKEHRSEPVLLAGTSTDHKEQVDFDDKSDQFPVLENFRGDHRRFVDINGKPGVVASKGESVKDVAQTAGIDLDKFLDYNDLNPSTRIKEGEIFYLKKKRNKANVHFHITRPGETLWSVSQKYGIKLKKILQKNRMAPGEEPEPGRVLWLRFIRPANQPVEFKPVYKPDTSPTLAQVSKNPTDNSNIKKMDDEPEVVKEKLEPVSNKQKDTEISEPHISAENNPKDQNLPKEPAVEATEQTMPKQIPTIASNKTEKSSPSVDTDTSADRNTNPGGPGFEVPDDFEFVEADSEQANGGYLHVVAPGETLYGISRRYSVSVEDIIDWNDMSLSASIKPGQQLVIKPVQESSTDNSEQSDNKTYINHKVQPGETLYKIARQYEVTIKELMDLNNKKDFNLSVGETLKVRSK